MNTLGIETTCDETGIALVRNGEEILCNIVVSSSEIHSRYGGVFPELACRSHIKALLPAIKEGLCKASCTPEHIDLIAVAKGPGLIGALLIGLQMAKGLSIAWNKPFIGVNHVEAHLYAAMMNAPKPLFFPALGFVLSGGHTLMLRIDGIGRYHLIGSTVDDAIGEAFDKVASLLGLPYPGGPPLEQLASRGDGARYPFSAGQVKRSRFDFSFSGLKTAVLYATRGKELAEQEKADIAASFQVAAFKDLCKKGTRALETFPARALYFGGGVCNNRYLRALFAQHFPHLPLFWPSFELTLDNGAMIAGLGYHKFLESGIGDPLDLEAQPRIPIA